MELKGTGAKIGRAVMHIVREQTVGREPVLDGVDSVARDVGMVGRVDVRGFAPHSLGEIRRPFGVRSWRGGCRMTAQTSVAQETDNFRVFSPCPYLVAGRGVGSYENATTFPKYANPYYECA
jgi:hypothetical protein